MTIVPSKKGFKLKSHTGKNLGDFETKLKAIRREQQVNYFKHKKQ